MQAGSGRAQLLDVLRVAHDVEVVAESHGARMSGGIATCRKCHRIVHASGKRPLPLHHCPHGVSCNGQRDVCQDCIRDQALDLEWWRRHSSSLRSSSS